MRRRRQRRLTAHCCLTPVRLARAPARSPTSSPSRMPHPSCDRPTHSPASPPRLRRRAANPPRVPRHSRDAWQGAGTPPAAEAVGLPHSNALLPFVASARHPGRHHRKDEGSSSCSPWRRAGHGHQHRQLFWEGDVGLIPAPRPLRLTTREQSQQRFLASPLRWGLPRALNTYFLLSEGSFVPNEENGKAGGFLFRIPFPWGASSRPGRSSP